MLLSTSNFFKLSSLQYILGLHHTVILPMMH